MSQLDEENLKDIIINPFNAVVLQDYLFDDHNLEVAKEDWVLKNVGLLREMSAKDWLEQFLVALTTDMQDDPTHTIINPYTGILFSKELQAEHQPIITRATWVDANVKGIQDVGSEAWLWRLLDVLETGGSNA